MMLRTFLLYDTWLGRLLLRLPVRRGALAVALRVWARDARLRLTVASADLDVRLHGA
jgi:hypothetical protein